MNQRNYFTEEQLAKIKKQGELLGSEKIREVESEWPQLIANVREQMDKGTPVEDPAVAELARRWKELMELFSGGDTEIIKAAERFHSANPDNPYGVDAQLYAFISRAISHL